MEFKITFNPQEIQSVKTLVADKLRSNRRFVQYRQKRNVEGSLPEVDDNALWMAHMMCLLSTQQRSGPQSAINRFLTAQPFPLSLELCRQQGALQEYTLQLLTDAQGIRRTNKIAKAVYANLTILEHGEWDSLRRWRDKLMEQRSIEPHPSHREVEEAAANAMEHFLEFGPKQTRNFWQSLGLTRYLFVLDSRIVKWLRQYLVWETGLLTSQGLNDLHYYRFISDILFDLCNQAEVLPCMLDAAVFDTFDEASEWLDETTIT